MKKIIFVLIVILLILIGSLLFFASENYLTGRVTKEENLNLPYSYTKAICNKTNYCEDYKIECEGEKTIRITATGNSVQHLENWKDPRNNPHKFCG